MPCRILRCLDPVDGRVQLNRIRTFYTIPYIDLGVSLVADGIGGISAMSCAVRVVLPGDSSLMSRGAIRQEQFEADSLRRESADLYAERLKEKYIAGASESSPAVISVNMLTASLAVQEFLARIHPYRLDDNAKYETIWMDFMTSRIMTEPPTLTDSALGKFLGWGNVQPLLNMPALGGQVANEH